MQAEPPAIIQAGPMSEAEWRAFVVSELRHLREQGRMNGEALEYLLRMAKEDEKRDEASHA